MHTCIRIKEKKRNAPPLFDLSSDSFQLRLDDSKRLTLFPFLQALSNARNHAQSGIQSNFSLFAYNFTALME